MTDETVCGVCERPRGWPTASCPMGACPQEGGGPCLLIGYARERAASASLKAELAAAREERDEARRMVWDADKALAAERTSAEGLREALRQYGIHKGHCREFPATSEEQIASDCSCGLTAALALPYEAKGRPKEDQGPLRGASVEENYPFTGPRKEDCTCSPDGKHRPDAQFLCSFCGADLIEEATSEPAAGAPAPASVPPAAAPQDSQRRNDADYAPVRRDDDGTKQPPVREGCLRSRHQHDEGREAGRAREPAEPLATEGGGGEVAGRSDLTAAAPRQEQGEDEAFQNWLDTPQDPNEPYKAASGQPRAAAEEKKP